MLTQNVPLHASLVGKLYVVGFEAAALTAATDFLELTAGSKLTLFLNEFRISQSTDVGDAAAENLRIALKRGAGNTAGSGGSTEASAPLISGDSAATSVVKKLNGTQAVAGGGTLTTLLEDAVPVEQGLHYRAADRMHRISARPGESLIISLDAAPADSVTFSGYAIFEEVGSSQLIEAFA